MQDMGTMMGGAGVTDKPGSVPASPAATPGGPGSGPTPSPMTTPQPNEGLRQAARVNIQIARDMLLQELPKIGTDSDEGKALLRVLDILSKSFGKSEDKDRELIPAETLQLLSSLKPGGGSPGAEAMAQKPPMAEPQPA